MKPHWTLRYLYNRTREWIYHTLHPQAPWLGPSAVRRLRALLQPGAAGFEAGSGRSTVWIGRRVGRLLSVEEDAGWFASVRERLHAARLQNVQLRLVSKEAGGYRMGYAGLVECMPEGSLDFALVDSEHERDYLVLALLPKLKPGGFLMLDNANWYLPSRSRAPHSRTAKEGPLTATWQQFLDAVKDWRCIWTGSGVTDTAFFIRP